GIERDVEPHRRAVEVDGVLARGIHERAAARRDDRVAQGQHETQDLPLDATEICFAMTRKDVGDGHPFARLDQLVDVLGAPAEAPREQPRHGGLAGGHEAHEIDLVVSTHLERKDARGQYAVEWALASERRDRATRKDGAGEGTRKTACGGLRGAKPLGCY